jgi:hypothetical protein
MMSTSGGEEVTIPQQRHSRNISSMIQGRCSLTRGGTYGAADSNFGGYRRIQADTLRVKNGRNVII